MNKRYVWFPPERDAYESLEGDKDSAVAEAPSGGDQISEGSVDMAGFKNEQPRFYNVEINNFRAGSNASRQSCDIMLIH